MTRNLTCIRDAMEVDMTLTPREAIIAY